MENASKALLIAGAILLCILIIAIGMFIFNSANDQINESVTGMSRNQITAFNSTFTNYEGACSGAQIKSLMGELIANADTYREEPTKIPGVKVDQLISGNNNSGFNTIVSSAGDTSNYIKNLGNIRNRAEAKHEYYVEINYQANGLIDYINISFEVAKPMNADNLGVRNTANNATKGG